MMRFNERGAALVLVLLALLLVIVLSLSVMSFAMTEMQIAKSHRNRTVTGTIIEAGADHVRRAVRAINNYDHIVAGADDNLGNSDDGIFDGFPTLGTEGIPVTGVAFNQGRYFAKADSVFTFFLGGDSLSILVVTLRAEGPDGSEATADMWLEYQGWPLPRLVGGLVSPRGIVKTSPNGGISGVDQCADSTPRAGVTVPEDGFQFNDTLGNVRADWNPEDVVSGDPPILYLEDVLSYLEASGIDWPAILGGNFDYEMENKNGWPDPYEPDVPHSYHMTGADVEVLSSNSGSGLLVVDNVLNIKSGFEWDGVILVGQHWESTGSMVIDGAIVSGLDLLLGEPVPQWDRIGPGDIQMTYNSCEVVRSGASAGSPVPPGAISWVSTW